MNYLPYISTLPHRTLVVTPYEVYCFVALRFFNSNIYQILIFVAKCCLHLIAICIVLTINLCSNKHTFQLLLQIDMLISNILMPI